LEPMTMCPTWDLMGMPSITLVKAAEELMEEVEDPYNAHLSG